MASFISKLQTDIFVVHFKLKPLGFVLKLKSKFFTYLLEMIMANSISQRYNYRLMYF